MERRDRLIIERSRDPLKPTAKLPDPTVCPECEATYHEGRWTWRRGPADAQRSLCPACIRTREGYAAGFVELFGAFALGHDAEIRGLVHNLEQREKEEHPMNRILDIEKTASGMLIRTTDIHLARSIGTALQRAYEGALEIQDAEDVTRVKWTRDA